MLFEVLLRKALQEILSNQTAKTKIPCHSKLRAMANIIVQVADVNIYTCMNERCQKIFSSFTSVFDLSR